jgi:hypothetical protein
MSPTLEKIRQRDPVPIDKETFDAALAYFRQTPEEVAVFVTWDNRCLPEKTHVEKNSIRFSGEGDEMKAHGGVAANLVSIQTDGIPIRISRMRKDIHSALKTS